MTNIGLAGLLMIVANIAFSYKGFTNPGFFDAYTFEVDKILINKDYKRLVTSGFLHVSWTHLLFNMFSLYAFCGHIENTLGELPFLVIYFASLIGGDLLSLLVHKNHGDYSAVGASGAVCGIIFASIVLYPGMSVGFFGLPFSMPGWLYGMVYVGYAIYGIKSKKGNIGHDAHLGGALVGMATALLFEPTAIEENYITILVICIPTIALIYLIITKPHFLLADNFFFKKHDDYFSIDHKYNAEKTSRQKEIDKILDKINSNGMDSLSQAEKEKLKKYSR
ncbi:rhomboid family intramembrane serine protease [Ferruginibacter paludis]|uniref:rhomboid family intramembrane serine protease n=1 Tax=Ferruginibacter paludis TaxID=1310417 RepID=UPI0025B62825|nr:rhomboid family intramembrane serine protease [Ferruginibacter paludis]MDN3655907.1 rhomboid family intramembrane serine protease [Ferruginibacter paludis]